MAAGRSSGASHDAQPPDPPSLQRSLNSHSSDSDESSARPIFSDRSESARKPKITYARDFLLSFSGLEICKKLPRGFDQSILSEFEDSSQERPRIGGYSLRRYEYGSSPPTRGDTGNFSRGNHGRWDNRSSGKSDRDSDSQSEWDSDSGKRYGNQPRRSWQVPEHDGLLGSGSFPRPSGYAPGASVPKPRANDQQTINRSNEPYQPPRPFKAAPYSRRDTDSLNDETFGSSEYNSEDRAEEERKRRASFELMRKEQQKLFQEKQKLNLDKPKDDFDTLAEDSKDEKILLDRNNLSNEPMIQPASNIDSLKSSFSSQTPASRPLVPPGFAKTSGVKSLIHTRPEEAWNPELQDGQLLAKSDHVLGGVSDMEEKLSANHVALNKQQYENTTICSATTNKNVNTLHVSTAFYDSNKAVGINSQSRKPLYLSEAFEAPESREAVELDAENVLGNKILAKSSPDHSGSILEKLFGNVLPLDGGGPSTESTSNKVDKAWSPRTVQSSKFAHWFHEEEKEPVENLSSGSASGLLSLIVGREKGGSQVSNVAATQHVHSNFLLQIPGLADDHLTSNLTPVSVGKSEQLHNNNKPDVVPAVLTCEDLEQSILSEISDNTSTLLQPVEVWGTPDAKIEQPKVIDNSASQHLLSLLQKGPGPQGMMSSTKHDTRYSDEHELHSIEVASNGLRETTENAHNSSNSLTLETLFGSAFMEELQSVGAPVSIQRAPVGSTRIDVSEPHGLSFPTREDGLHPSATPNHQFPPSMLPPPLRHPSNGLPGFDPPAHPHPMLQQMHMAGNFPPPHLIQGFPRGGPVVPHPSNQPSFIQELNQMQGLPLAHRQPNFGGIGISPPVADRGSNHPEAFQRLIERELRSNPNQIHPNHELDMRFGYR